MIGMNMAIQKKIHMMLGRKLVLVNDHQQIIGTELKASTSQEAKRCAECYKKTTGANQAKKE